MRQYISQLPETAGIFAIRQLNNYFMYVSCSTNIKDAALLDYAQLVKGVHPCKSLQTCFNHHGEEAYDIIVYAETDLLDKVEAYRDYVRHTNFLFS